jgi:hypothetical protein
MGDYYAEGRFSPRVTIFSRSVARRAKEHYNIVREALSWLRGSGKVRQPIQVSVYPARSAGSDWEYLLLRCVPLPDLGLGAFWQGVTGGVEEGEDLVEAATRELSKER